VNEIIAAAIGVPLTFLLGWWGRGKWERYPWNAKPQRWSLPLPESTSAEELRAGPVGQFERQVAKRTAVWAEAWRSTFDLALSAVEQDSVIAKLSDGVAVITSDEPLTSAVEQAIHEMGYPIIKRKAVDE
jgi:hypothetical protein